MTEYPTKEEILREEVKFPREVLALVRRWKADHWKEARDKGEQSRFEAVSLLLQRLNAAYGGEELRVKRGGPDRYRHDNRTVYLSEPTSLVTALHEFAHHLGKDEHDACKWSVWLFRKTFKKAYEKLTWNGHTLVRKEHA